MILAESKLTHTLTLGAHMQMQLQAIYSGELTALMGFERHRMKPTATSDLLPGQAFIYENRCSKNSFCLVAWIRSFYMNSINQLGIPERIHPVSIQVEFQFNFRGLIISNIHTVILRVR